MSLFYGPCLMLYWNDLLQSPVKAFFLSNSISRLRHLRSCLLFQAVVSRHQIVVLTIFTRVRKHVVQKGDTVIDATCGNGYDTLVMVNVLADELAGVVFMQWIFRMMLYRILLLCQKYYSIQTRCPFRTVPFIILIMSAKENRKLHSCYFWDVTY